MEIVTANRAYQILVSMMTDEVEELWALALGPQKALLQSKMLFRGTVDACLAHPRDIFRFACLANASSILIAHNHPSGDPRPSTEDLALTRQLIRASKALQIPLVDHLIITSNGYTSLASSGRIRFV